MRIENTFTVEAPAEAVWISLLDVERVAPCMPGATLLEVLDDGWRGKVDVRFGPVPLTFEGVVTMVKRDDVTHRMTLRAQGREQKGKGAATAEVVSWTQPGSDGGTEVVIATDITLTGSVAQLSRGLLPEVSRKLTKQFAECLQASMASPGRPEPPAPRAVGGVRLGLGAIWALLTSFVAKLFRPSQEKG